jgi:hypothetical protein
MARSPVLGYDADGSAWSGHMARWRGILLGLGFALLAQAPGIAADERDIFTVAAVPVDATAANANAARDAARIDGERRAYAILLGRLTLAADRDRLPPASDARLDDLVSGFEVAKERVSGVRYLADYTYHFRADAVRNLLRQAGVPFAETPSKPVVVLAVLQGDAGTVLWEEPNPWRDAWSKRPPRSGLVPLVVPYGDLEDLQAIDADAAVRGDLDRLQAISQRYGGADILVSVAKLASAADPHTLAVSSTRLSIGSAMAPQSMNKSYSAASGQSDADLIAAAVAGTAQQVEDGWKTANLLDYRHTGTMSVRVPLADLKSWIAIRDRLAGIPAIQRSDLVALDRDEARLAIHYYGDPEQLRLALAQRDLALTGSDPDWVLARRQAASAN